MIERNQLSASNGKAVDEVLFWFLRKIDIMNAVDIC